MVPTIREVARLTLSAALLLALCGGCLIGAEPAPPSASARVEGPWAVGRAVPFTVELTDAALDEQVEIFAARNCGVGVIDVVLDGPVASSTTTSRDSFSGIYEPGTLTSVVTGTLMVSPADEGRVAGSGCAEAGGFVQLTVIVGTSADANVSAITPVLRMEDGGV